MYKSFFKVLSFHLQKMKTQNVLPVNVGKAKFVSHRLFNSCFKVPCNAEFEFRLLKECFTFNSMTCFTLLSLIFSLYCDFFLS